MTADKTLLLLDGHSLAFRAFYSLNPANFSTTGGQHTNAVYGFLSMFLGLMEKEKPTHIAAAFDLSGPTFRSEEFPAYKAQRPPSPPEFAGQISLIQEVLTAAGIPSFTKESYEADDIIASFATQAQSEGFRVLICTGDRDSLQLVTEDITVLYTLKGVSQLERFTPTRVKEKYDVTPAQYPDLAALRGDPSDNLPGIKGVGPKTAAKWLEQFGDLDGIIAHQDELKGKAGQSFRDNVDDAVMGRRMTAMVTDLDLIDSFDALIPADAEASAIDEVFDRLEFGKRLRQRFLGELGIESAEEPTEPVRRLTLEAGKLGSWLNSNPWHALLMDDGGEELCLVTEHREGTILNLADLSTKDEKALRTWLANPRAPKWCHSAKALYHLLAEQGFDFAGVEHDATMAALILRPEMRATSLPDLHERLLGSSLPADATLLDRTQAIAAIIMTAVEELAKSQAEQIYYDLEVPLTLVLARMERRGIAVELPVLEELAEGYRDAVEREVSAAREIAQDPKLNLSSPKQLQRILFDELGLPTTKKTKTGYSTAAAELEKLAAETQHPFLNHLMAHREYQKMKTTIDGLIDAVAPDGRIHTTFNQSGASTGRMSSSEPNLQNIPVRTEAGRAIRAAFVVGEDYEGLMTADYSQIEMRVMAHLSQDPGLIEAYATGEDLHNYVGSQVFDVPVDDVTPDLRRKVKALSYGLAYGLSAFGLSQQLSISVGEAKHIMSQYFERFGGVRTYLDTVVEDSRARGYTETLYGRRRYLPDLTSSNHALRENAGRAALNAPIQGTAAEIMKIAMIKVEQELTSRELDSRLLLQVHDELIVEVAHGEREEVEELLVSAMDSAAQLSVPLDVSAGFGPNWDAAAH